MISSKKAGKYIPKKFEGAWQKKWTGSDVFTAKDFDEKKKYYVLVEFPYPSGEGLHVGHCLSYIAQDIIARWKRMQGYNVLYPIGWDAFGLPTENFAIKNKIKPQDATKKNIANFKRQIQSLGISFDWSREVNTAGLEYYRWTQWIFLQLFKHGLAEKKEVPINWCPKDKIGLAFEEVVDGKCERCGAETERRNIKQWVLKITKYADRLIDDLETVDYLPAIKQQQINWIGRSEGALIKFKIKNEKLKSEIVNFKLNNSSIEVFTTRPDTLFGATYVVLSPEHELLVNNKLQITNYSEVQKYIEKAKHKTERERQETKEKTGVELKGVKAINPANNEEIPIWVADYVFASYGTGAIMAVPAHDERDWEFVQYVIAPETREPVEKLIRHVILPVSSKDLLPYIGFVKVSGATNIDKAQKLEAENVLKLLKQNKFCYPGTGTLVNSDEYSGFSSEEAGRKIMNFVSGKKTVQYKLRDWIFSRQHYWGEPIPIVICESCGYVPLEEKDLPLELPDVKYYEPTDTGESPLAGISKWVNVKCPKCGGKAKRETDTMPNWAGSSWYFLRYTDPHNDKEFADQKKLKYWLPIDLYNGGAEHTTLHLLYSRFWHKFLYDIKKVPTAEPYMRRVQHGMILGLDGAKMSKSRGNVINPDETVEKFGADTFRLYMMFMGEYDQVKIWSDTNLQGVARFMNRLWKFFDSVKLVDTTPKEQLSLLHETIQKVSNDLERRSFNTAVSQFMIFLNKIESHATVGKEVVEAFLKILSPFAPHASEELWHSFLGEKKSVQIEKWPEVNKAFIAQAGVRVGIQVNGKVRADILVTNDMSEAMVRDVVLSLSQVQKYVGNAPIKKFIYIKNKIVSIVV